MPRRAGLLLAPWGIVVLLWYALHYSGLVDPALVPAPHEVLRKLDELVRDRLLRDMWMFARRVFAGVFLGVSLAVPVGFALGWYGVLRRFAEPVINFFRALPPIALIPLIILYVGIGESTKIALLGYASFFAGVIVMYEGIAQINPVYIRVARTLGATDREIFTRIVVPLIFPHLLIATRVALGVAWATLVASELLAVQRDLGAFTQDPSSFLQFDVIYVGIVCVALIALVTDLLLRALSRRMVAWQEPVA